MKKIWWKLCYAWYMSGTVDLGFWASYDLAEAGYENCNGEDTPREAVQDEIDCWSD